MSVMSAVFLLYVAALVLFGFRSSRCIKGIDDFFVARKGASVKSVAGSLVATILGGSAVMGAIDAGPSMGGASAWFMLVGAAGLLLLLPLSGRAYRLGKFSLPDLIYRMYGDAPSVATRLIVPIAWTGIVAAQIIAGAKLLQSIIPFGYDACACIVATIFILYTIAGGQVSILRTDFFQAILVVTGLSILFAFAYLSGGIDGRLPESTTPVRAFPFNDSFSSVDLILLVLAYGSTFTAGPDVFSRIFCARSENVAKKSIAAASVVLVLVAFLIGYLSAFGATFTNVEGSRIMTIVHAVLPASLEPLMAISLMSVVLSSADTTLLGSSVIICGLLNFRKPKNNQKSVTVRAARAIILINGVAALVIALNFSDIISTLLFSLSVYAGAFTVPILWGLCGFSSGPRYVACAMVLGGLLALLGKVLQNCESAPRIIPDILLVTSFVVNGIVLAAGRHTAISISGKRS